jgi:hypothetical protein
MIIEKIALDLKAMFGFDSVFVFPSLISWQPLRVPVFMVARRIYQRDEKPNGFPCGRRTRTIDYSKSRTTQWLLYRAGGAVLYCPPGRKKEKGEKEERKRKRQKKKKKRSVACINRVYNLALS